MSRDVVRMGGIVAVTLIVAITALTIFHPGDNTAIISSMVAAALALFSALSSRTNAGRIQDNADRIESTAAKTDAVHKIVNSQRAAMQAEIDRLGAVAEGLRTERAIKEDRKDRPGESS